MLVTFGSTPSMGGDLPAQKLFSAEIEAECGALDEAAFLQLSGVERTAYLTCCQRAVASVVNLSGPRSLDATTTSTGASASGTILTYHVRIELAGEDLSEADVRATIEAARLAVCRSSGMSTVIRLGGGYRYVWVDRKGEAIGETTVDRC